MFQPNKRIPDLMCAVVLIGAAATAMGQGAANYPSRVVRVVVAYPPGGGVTPVAQVFANKLTKDLGQNFLIDNRPGGNTIIGTEITARATPDGHTLQLVTNTHVINPWVQPKLPYDTLKDFAVASTVIRNNHALVLHPGVPANTLKEFIAYLKKNGDKVNAAVTGVGSPNHIATLLFMQATGTKFNVVPYKGSGIASTDLVAGQVQMSINSVTPYAPLIRAGKLKGLAVSGERHSAVVPDVPTFTEAGMKGFVAANWYALITAGATPRDIVQKLNGAIARAQADAEVVAQLAKLGVEPFPNNLGDTQTFVRLEMQNAGKIIKEYDIKPEND